MVEQHLPYDDLYYSQNEILTPTDMAATRERLQETLYGEAAGRSRYIRCEVTPTSAIPAVAFLN